MSEYIRTNKFDTNECPNIFEKEKLIRTNVRIYIRDQYIRIFEYIRHTLVSTPHPQVNGRSGEHYRDHSENAPKSLRRAIRSF